MSGNGRRWFQGFLVVVASLGMTARALQVQQMRSHPYGKLTENQVLKRGEELCAVIDSRTLRGRFTVSYTMREADIPSWEVVCADDSGEDIAHLSWDALTGELHSV